MDNSGRREAPITFFFFFFFVSYNIYTPQGNPILRVENKTKGFLVIHRLWMSLLVLSSGVFFYFHSLYFLANPTFRVIKICLIQRKILYLLHILNKSINTNYGQDFP